MNALRRTEPLASDTPAAAPDMLHDAQGQGPADHRPEAMTRLILAKLDGKAQVEGLPQADWVLIDAGDVIVHLFRPEVRSFYNIEKIWSVEPPRAAQLA